ncbi:MAG: hypothetical protein WDW36_008124 [Sanguina aurantia]
MRLGGPDLTHTVTFLKALTLTNLVVEFEPFAGHETGQHAIDTATTQCATQLQWFVTHMGPALCSIRALHISLPSSVAPFGKRTAAAKAATALQSAATAILLPLASACPHLAQLAVSAGVSAHLLGAFGAACPHLTTLRAPLAALEVGTLQRLSSLLPRLTSLWLSRHPALSVPAEADSAARTALGACPKLLSFDSQQHNMTPELWAALPLGLTSCVTLGFQPGAVRAHSTPATWQPHGNLRTLETMQSLLSIHGLALYLAAAPSLSSLVLARSVTCFYAWDTVSLADELQIVDARVGAGLDIATRNRDGKTGPGKFCIEFSTQCYTKPKGDTLTYSFLAASMSPLPSLSCVLFQNNDRQMDLSQLARVFPGLLEMFIASTTLVEDDFLALAACPALASVELLLCKGVTCERVSAMCVASKSLRQLRLLGCVGITGEDALLMKLQGWGGKVGLRFN